MKTNYRPHNGLLETFGIVNSKEYPKSTLPIKDIDESRYLWEESGVSVIVSDKTIKLKDGFANFATIDLSYISNLRVIFAGEVWQKVKSKEDGVRMIKERIKLDPDLVLKFYGVK